MKNMHNPPLIRLAPLSKEDLPFLWDWINDRELVLFNAPYKPVHEFDHQKWFEAISNRKDTVIFGIRLKENDQLIGTCQLHSIHPVNRTAELQIRIGTVKEQGKGYGKMAVQLLLDFAFKDLNLRRVFLHVFNTNTRAIAVYEKAGFKREGLLRQDAFIDEKYVDVAVMGILREEYNSQEARTN
jgi:RimJ/RimL family protein N-acetyltransferase